MQSLAHGNSADFTDDYTDFRYYEDSDADGETEASMLGNTVFDVNSMLGVLDAEIYNPIETILMMDPAADGRVSLAYERLTHIPRPFAETFAQSTHTLDLSHNNLKDLSFLGNFRCLNTLILDQNDTPTESTLPYLPSLRILWLNNCRIYDLAAWTRRLQSCCPELQHLSLLGNPGCLSAFNGGTVHEHLDYRLFVVGALPQLQHLDDGAVTDVQRAQAQQHRSAYALHGGPMKFVEKFGTAKMLGLFRSETLVGGIGFGVVASNGSRQSHRKSLTTNGNGSGGGASASTTVKKRGHTSTTSATTDSSQ